MTKLQQLRNLMKTQGIDTYIITKFDPHQGEYTHDKYNGVKFISGFSGSSATAVVTQTDAFVWTDSRYYLQAEKELTDGFVMKKIETDQNPYAFSLAATPKGTIGFDGLSISVKMMGLLTNHKNPQLTIKTNANLLSEMWENRPEFTREKVWNYDEKHTGESTASKLLKIRKEMADKNVDLYILSSIDDIAWLLNIRSMSSESSFNFYAYLAIEQNNLTLFMDSQPEDEKLNVDIRPYEDIWAYAKSNSERTLLYAPARTNLKLFNQFSKQKVSIPYDITTVLKAKKNEVEIKNLKLANEKEALVFTKLNRWLSNYSVDTTITEYDVYEKLDQIRHKLDGYLSRSFSPICGYGSNGAIVHYHLNKETAKEVKREGFLLVDTGSNFIEGTTDITRTYAMGPLTDDQKRHYTAVLKGHIALATAVFPKGTKGYHLDVLARMPLWEMGLNYGHGTGHGIGHMLNVHEGPQNISPTAVDVPLEAGMLLSNEPGVYFAGAYGIRLENTILVKKCELSGSDDFLEFETVSFIPFDLTAIEPTLLTEKEKAWLNTYHKKCFEQIKCELCETGQAWLSELTKAI